MKENSETDYVKRSQKDYSMCFKLQVVGEVERGELTIGDAARKYGVQNPSTVTNWLRKFGTFDWQTQTPSVMKRTPEQTIFELERGAINTDVLRKTVRQTVDIYNNLRPHLSCALLTPTQMHGQAELTRATYHKKSRSKQTLAPNNKITNFNQNPVNLFQDGTNPIFQVSATNRV